MRASRVMVLALGVAAYEEETAMLQVQGDQGDVPKYAKDKVEKVEKYIKAAYGDHVDVVLPDPVWLTHSEDPELVIRNCHAHGAKKCSTFHGGKALMDSMKDDTAYGRGTAHYGEHCCVEKVKQCETKYVTHCHRQKAKDLTYAQCKKVAKHAKSLFFQSVVDKKAQFPGCYYRKADGKTFWNSFEAETGYGKGGASHGDRKAYAPICRVRRCKNSKTEYKKVEHPKEYKKVEHPKEYKKVAHPKAYRKAAQLALGVAAYEEETAMLQVQGDQGDVPEYAKDKVEKVEKYIKAAYGDHVDVVLPDPVWLTHSEDPELVIRNCHAHGAKKCSTFHGGKALMDSMKDDTAYGRGTAHYGEHCCVEKVKQCETKYVTHCHRQKAKDLTYAQCQKVAKHATSLFFQSVVDKKAQFPGCYYRKADGKTFWNSFEAETGYGKGGASHGDRKAYAPICRVRRCKNSKTEYTKVEHPKEYKTVGHPKEYKTVEHPKQYKKVAHPKAYKKVAHPKAYKKVAHPKAYKKVAHPKAYKKVAHPKAYKKVEHRQQYKKVDEPKYEKVQ